MNLRAHKGGIQKVLFNFSRFHDQEKLKYFMGAQGNMFFFS